MNQPLFRFSTLRGSAHWFIGALLLDSLSVLFFLFIGSIFLLYSAIVTTAYCVYLGISATKMDFFDDHVTVKNGRKTMDQPYSRISKVGIFESGGFSHLEVHRNVYFCVEGGTKKYKIPRNSLYLFKEPPDSARSIYDWLRQKTSASAPEALTS